MKRFGLIVAVSVGIAVALFVASDRPDHITLSVGKAMQMGPDGFFVASLDIVNDGPADQLIGVASEDVLGISIMNQTGGSAPMVVPGADTAQLAMDGAHMMVQAVPSDFPEGGFLPVTLTFEKAGEVTARLQNTGPTAMRHGMMEGVAEEPAPVVRLDWAIGPNAEGGTLEVAFENMAVVQVPEGTEHVPGEGHAHVYLNGLKLGRVYDEPFEIGALLPGTYQIVVSVNAHDHRPYLAGGEPVQAALEFSIP